MWFEADLLHVEADLLGHFPQYLLRQIVVAHAVIEADKLYNVACSHVALHVAQKAVIAVEILHASEVCAANSHDDDARGCTRSSDDSSDCLLHVSNLSISD